MGKWKLLIFNVNFLKSVEILFDIKGISMNIIGKINLLSIVLQINNLLKII